MNLSVYTQEDTVEKYLYQSDLPEMSEFTTCFWLKIDSNEIPQDQYILSLATSCKTTLFWYLFTKPRLALFLGISADNEGWILLI